MLVPKSEEGVGDRKFVFGAHGQEEEAIAVHLSNALRTKHALPALVVLPNSCVEVSQDDKLVIWVGGLHQCVQVLVERLLDVVWASQGGGVNADDGHVTGPGEGESKLHEAFVDADGELRELGHEGAANGEADTMYPVLVLLFAFPEEGVASLGFADRSLIREPRLT